MSREIIVNFDKLPIVKIRVIDKNDSDFIIKSKKKYPFILMNNIIIKIKEPKKNFSFYFEIQKDYIWNGADIPKPLFFIGQSKDNNYLTASLVHDFMIEKRDYIYNICLKKQISTKEYRKLTSLIFRQILKDEKTNVIKANIMSWFVDVYQMSINKKIWKELGER